MNLLTDRKFLIGVAVGVGIMYFFQPFGRRAGGGGGRRRAGGRRQGQAAQPEG